MGLAPRKIPWPITVPYYFDEVLLPFLLCSFCPKTKYVMKVDDNAEINYSVLLQQLKTKIGPDGGLPFGAIFCPSPMRNMRPWYPRPSGGFKTVMGKWSVKTYEMSRRWVSL